MGIFIRRNKPNRAYSNGSFVPRWTSPPQSNKQEWLQYFTKSPRLAVVDRIASDLAFAEGKLFEVDAKGNERELTAHPFLDFMNKPNPMYELTPAALWRLHQIYLDLSGEGGMVMERGQSGEPVELWPVPSQWIMQTPYQGHPFYQVRTTSGGIMDIPVEDMFMQKELNPMDPYMRGAGKAESIADEIEIDEYAAKFQKRFFFNDATPALIIAMPGSDPDQRDRFISQWKERFKGFFNSHSVAAVGGDATINKISENMKDMDMIEGRKFLRDAALEHFNVPREIMGITESSNRATSEAAQYIYAQNTLMPRLRMREDAINIQILPYFGEHLVWRFDDIVPRNEEFDKAKAIENWNAGLITKNQALELQGMASIGEMGEVYKTDMATIFYSKSENPVKVFSGSSVMGAPSLDAGYGFKSKHKQAERQTKDDALTAAYTVEGEDVDHIISAYVAMSGNPADSVLDARVEAAVQRTLDATLKTNEAKISREIQKYFTHQSNALQVALESVPTATLESLTNDAEIKRFIQGLIDWDGEAQALENILSPLWQESLDAGKNYAIQHFGIEGNIMGAVPAALNPKERIAGIINTTQDRMVVSIRNGNLGGLALEDTITQALDNVNNNPERVKIIAENEAHTAVMTGQHSAMKSGGYDGKRWVSEGDFKVRPSHRRVNGQIRPIDEPFDLPGGIKMMYPGDPSAPLKETINCRCGMVPVRLSRGSNATF